MGQNNEKQINQSLNNQQQQAAKPSASSYLGKIPIQPVPGSRGLRNRKQGIISVYWEKNRQIYDIRLTPGLTIAELKEILTAKIDQKIFPRHVKLYLSETELHNSALLQDIILNKNLLRMEIIDPSDYSVNEHSLMNIVLQSQKGEVRYQYRKNGPLSQMSKATMSPTNNVQKEHQTYDQQNSKINGRYTPQNGTQYLNNSSSGSQSSNSVNSAPSHLKPWDIDFSVYKIPEVRISSKLLRKNKISQANPLNIINIQSIQKPNLFDLQLQNNNFVIEEMEEEETGKHTIENQS